jgi:polysaccharide export outer membrane protein
MKKYFFYIFLILFQTISIAQITDYELGAKLNRGYYQQTGYFDLSDPEAVNIKVAVWGFVRYPGKYIVPTYTTVLDLLSYAGGPSDDADLEDLRLYRTNEDGKQELIKINYNDIMWESNLDQKYRIVPGIEAGDILVVTGEPRLYARDKVSLWLSILSALISLTILVLNIVKN